MQPPWSMFTKLLGGKPAPPVLALPAKEVRPPQPRHALERGPLNEVGQQSEHVRERVVHLSGRLDDLKSLADDFGAVIEPLNEFIVQHTQSKSKLLEMEALLSRERELSFAARSELNELQASASKMSGDLSAALAELRSRDELLREQDTDLTQQRLRLDDQHASIDNLERQLASETERARAVSDDNQALRADIDGLEQFKSRAEADLAETRQLNATANAENARLQQLAESYSQRVAAFKGQIIELEPQIQAGRQEVSILQIKLAAEQAARQKFETNREVERTAQDAEIQSLAMKIEGLNAHVTTNDKMLANLRDQLRDRSEALRISERTLKDILAEKVAAERRAETAQEAFGRQAIQISEGQRSVTELKERCEMLAKALSAKDSALESGNRKAINLAERIDQMNERFQQERTSFELTNRRLIEELQSERAERSLAQGALDIARSSRTKLLSQYTAFKRQYAASGAKAADGVPEEDIFGQAEPPDNVHVFKGTDRSE